MKKSSNLKKGILTIFIANVINIIFKVFISFAQPIYLTVDDYSQIQTYNLYISYIGILHLGYVDGMYLDFGGLVINTKNSDKINKNIANLRISQLIIMIIVMILALVIKNSMLFFIAISILPLNIIAYFRALFQTTGIFDLYAKSLNIHTFLLFLGNIICIFILKSRNYVEYILMQIFVCILVWVILECIGKRKLNLKLKKFFEYDFREFWMLVKIGLPLTLGNLSSGIFASLDRWFIKFLLTTQEFAYYSFAVTIETFLNAVISPITISLYNYMCVNKDRERISKLKSAMILFSTVVVGTAFPAKFIIEVFIPNYMLSTSVIFILFASKAINIVIQGVYVNLYKSSQKQNIYFVKIIICICIGIITNIVAYMIFPRNISFAIATLLTTSIWLIMSANDFKEYIWKWNEVGYLFFSVIGLCILGQINNTIIGFILYIVLIIILIFLFMKKEFGELKRELFQGKIGYF